MPPTDNGSHAEITKDTTFSWQVLLIIVAGILWVINTQVSNRIQDTKILGELTSFSSDFTAFKGDIKDWFLEVKLDIQRQVNAAKIDMSREVDSLEKDINSLEGRLQILSAELDKRAADRWTRSNMRDYIKLIEQFEPELELPEVPTSGN